MRPRVPGPRPVPTEPREDGTCPVCRGEVRLVGSSLWGDITWPECDDCDWQGTP